jgi:glycosyltransferase involved in cell wall biosynthesis
MITVIIPTKNEPYLNQTIADIEANASGVVEIIIGDDAVANIGQRAMMNALARKAEGEYIMKLDAHCSLGKGWDKIMLEDMQDNWILAPYLLPLDVERWQVKTGPRHSLYYFDTNLVMQHGENNEEEVNETMCLQGSCFLVATKNYWDWNLCDEELGSWGGQGVELGIKAFLNGGKCMTTKKTYYGHWFRTKEEEFPYLRDMKKIRESQKNVIEKLKTKAIAPLIEKWNFPCDWTPKLVNELP